MILINKFKQMNNKKISNDMQNHKERKDTTNGKKCLHAGMALKIMLSFANASQISVPN